MNFQQRIDAFVQLGEFLGQAAANGHPRFAEAHVKNNWFTPENTTFAVQSWAHLLTQPKLSTWLNAYDLKHEPAAIVAIIMAGNIPLVGFHDLLCVLVTGNKALVKCSADDEVLIEWVIKELIRIEPQMADFIAISKERLPKEFEAVIATGSDNTNRYFEYYFRNRHALLRRNRTSVAVLTGNETPEDMQKLADDIFRYFGLGCRSVSKLYLPAGYDIATFFEGIEHYKTVLLHHKYTNNYNYHKALFLMNLEKHYDNNFILLKEDASVFSPLGTLFYSTYETPEQLMQLLAEKRDDIQCIVSKVSMEGSVPFGRSQSPELWNYADGVDTIRFLEELPQSA